MARQTVDHSFSDAGQPGTVELPQPEWTHEECAAYEAARECIIELIAHRNAWVYEERNKPQPDQSAIERWRKQIMQFVEETRRLNIKNHDQIRRVRHDYGAECRRLMADPDLRM